MLTSISEETVVEECVTRGASYFIRKDVRADLLKTELQGMLQQFFPGEPKTHEQPHPNPGQNPLAGGLFGAL